MFDGKSQTTRAGRTKHQPVGSTRKVLVRQRFAEVFVIDPVILDDDPRFGNSRRSAGFKNVSRFTCQPLRHPLIKRASSEVFVFEQRKSLHVLKALDVFPRIEVEGLCFFEPVVAAGFRVEVPFDTFANMGIELFFGISHFLIERIVAHWTAPSGS